MKSWLSREIGGNQHYLLSTGRKPRFDDRGRFYGALVTMTPEVAERVWGRLEAGGVRRVEGFSVREES